MRYVPTYCIRGNAILAKTILGANGEILLREGVELKESYMRKLLELRIPGVYIHDELSRDLEIIDVLSDEVRAQVTSGIKNIFANATKQNASNAPNTSSAEYARSKDIRALADNIVDELLSANTVMANLADIKVYDDYTFFHCVQVAILSVILGIGLGYSRSKLVKLAVSGLMHDIGKVFVPEAIINKNGPLTPEEYDEVKRHSQNGYEYLGQHYKLDMISIRGVLDHHERYDGSGYPNAKSEQSISEFGRIIAVADVYDALISDRPYRKGLFAAEAIEYILGGSGAMFDPKIVSMMNQKVALFPLGTCVLLSNGCTGLVMENYEGYGQRPKLKVFMQNDASVEPYLLDLCNDYSTLDITVVATVAM